MKKSFVLHILDEEKILYKNGFQVHKLMERDNLKVLNTYLFQHPKIPLSLLVDRSDQDVFDDPIPSLPYS